MFKWSAKNNHFGALLTPKDNFHTILDYPHTNFDLLFQSFIVETSEPMWIEIVNETNAVNNFSIYGLLKPAGQINENYGFELKKYENFGRNFVYLIYFWCRSWRKIPGFVVFCFRKFFEKIGIKKK